MLFPLKGLGALGILPDPEPYNLPPQAFSSGKNARYVDGAIVHAPVYRSIDTLTHSTPRFVTTNTPSAGNFDDIFTAYLSGRVYRWANGVETNYSITGYSDSSSESNFSSCSLGTVQYINREDREPWSLSSSDSEFKELLNWNSQWRTSVLRAYNGALVALNVTKSGVTYSNMVKTSDIVADIGAVPGSWDHEDTTTNATENLLSDMKGPITDGAVLGRSFCIYGPNESWLMTADGSDNVYRYQRLPFDKGAINVNCSVEVGGFHYVFGSNDIWKHDGVGEVSIANKRVLKFIFKSMNVRQANRCFVLHNPNLKEIEFYFVSGDDLIAFTTATGGCNRKAVYRYEDDTWWFDDAPLVYAGCYANTDTSETWATTPATWDNVGGSWLDQDDGFKKTPIVIGETSEANGLTAKLYAVDVYGVGSISSAPVDEVATQGLILRRTGIDLDELEDMPKRSYKNVLSLYPQARLDEDAEMIEFQFGAADYPNQSPTMSGWITYDGLELYKCDYMTAGRWLEFRMKHDDYKSISIASFDLDIEVTGDR